MRGLTNIDIINLERYLLDTSDETMNKPVPPAYQVLIDALPGFVCESCKRPNGISQHRCRNCAKLHPLFQDNIGIITESPPCESFYNPTTAFVPKTEIFINTELGVPYRPEHKSGFASIGLDNAKTPANVGSVIRAAHCYGVASIAISGERITGKHVEAATNTMQSHKHIPVYRGDLKSLIPFGAVPVAVDLVEGAESLVDFVHPRSAFYIFGAEDNTLGKRILDWCPRRVMVPTTGCMNLAAAVNVVLYDRMAKRARK